MGKKVVGRDYKSGELIQIDIEGQKISEIFKISNGHSDFWIAPGLVDLQINGFNGVNFNQIQIDSECIRSTVDSLISEGVTTFFPTLITNSDENLCDIFHKITQTVKDLNLGQYIGGFHLEGPFISKEDGPRGAHPADFVKAPDWDLFKKFQEKAEGKIKIITISPEWPNSTDFIEKCVQTGVKVAIGHTSATPEQVKNAIKAGAILSTHIGNATHSHLPRHENYLWEQLASDILWSTFIADGFHLPDSLLKIIIKLKSDKSILVSDSTMFAGLASGDYVNHIGGEITLDPSGRLYMKNAPSFLAGSAVSLLHCVEYLTFNGITTLAHAIDMASIKPMEVLGISNSIEVGNQADLIVFGKTEARIKIIATIKAGEVVYVSTEASSEKLPEIFK